MINERVDLTSRVVVTPLEAFRMLRIGRSTGYKAMADGQIPTIRIGRRLLVPLAALDRLLCSGHLGRHSQF